MFLGFWQVFNGCDESEVWWEELCCPGPHLFVVLPNVNDCKSCDITDLLQRPLVIGGLARHVDCSQCHNDIGGSLRHNAKV